ncbi:MAG: hypothetical protein NC099_05165 [Corallococcus sp.]|nr:hypothetical protein [Corallococcus sp.]
MIQDILYFSSIEFDKNDYYWLTQASLLWDKIYRIIPSHYEPNDDSFIKELCSTGEIGVGYGMVNYYQYFSIRCHATERFVREHEKNLQQYKKEFEHSSNKEFSRLSLDKANWELWSVLNSNDLLFYNVSLSKNFRYIPKKIADIYLSYLANEIAASEHFSLATPNSETWIFSAQNGCLDRYFEAEAKKQFAFPLYIKDIFPQNLQLSAKQILTFREKRKDERRNFIEKYNSFCERLSNAQNIYVYYGSERRVDAGRL